MNEQKEDGSDDRAPMAKAMDWVTRITTAGMSFGLPPLAGYWADQQLGTGYLLTLLGFLFGVFAGGWQLMKIARDSSAE